MALSKKPTQEVPKKPTASEQALITRFMSSKIGKKTPTKQAKPEEVKKAFESAKQRGAVPKTPELQQPTTMGIAKPVLESEALLKGDKEAMDNALMAYNANKVNQGFVEADATINTVNRMAAFDGYTPPAIGGSSYNQYKSQIDFLKPTLTLTNDEAGNPIYAQKMGRWDSFKAGIDGYNEYVAKGDFYQNEDENKVLGVLELNRKQALTKQTGRFYKDPNAKLYSLGNLSKPISDGTAVGIMSSIYTYLTGLTGTGAAVAQGISQFGTIGRDMVNSKYASTLEEAYGMARSQGVPQKEAYEKAKQVATSAGYMENVMQIPFSFSGAMRASAVGKGLPSSTKDLVSKFQVNKNATEVFAKGMSENLKVGAALGGMMGFTKAATDMQSESLGIKIDNNVERAISEAGHMFAMHMGMHTLSSSAGPALEFGLKGLGKGIKAGSSLIPGSAKAFAKNLFLSDKSLSFKFMDSMVEAGLYDKDDVAAIKSGVRSFESAKKKTPDFGGDEVRRTIAAGLIEKRSNLENKMKSLDKEFQAPVQVEIDEINSRIRKLNEVENPFEVEYDVDGTPFIQKPKIEENAIKTSEGVVQEGGPEGGISQYQGTEEVKPVEGAREAEAPKTDTSNRPVSGTEEVVQPTETVKFSDKIRKLKIDESVLTGGEKGVAQSNIAGLPIGIYNASIEAIALSVEAGEKIAVAVENQIKSLREGGRSFNEERFRKNVLLIDKVNADKARIAAESEMEGIKSADYVELQRLALEKYNESEVFRDPEYLGKRLREELSKKMDTSNISDNVFEMVAYDAIANEKQAPFMPGTKTKVELPYRSYSLDEIVTNPREIFKAMYTAAKTQAKSTKERLRIASDDIAEAIYKKKNIRINPNAVSKAIRMFVNDSMDTETASIAFADNMAEIMRRAENSVKFGQIKKKINSIRAAARSKSYGTVGTFRDVQSMDFIAPSKVRDYDAQGKVLDSDVSLNKYMALLEDVEKSVTGKIPDGTKVRNEMKDFLYEQKSLYDNAQKVKLEARRKEFEAKYDKLLAENKIDINEDTKNPLVTKEEFVEAMMNPEKVMKPEVESVVEEASLEEAPTLAQQARQRQEVLKETIDEGEIDPEFAMEAQELSRINPEYISPQNLKLFNNIIEDILNGQEPSRHGQIIEDVMANVTKETIPQSEIEIRPISKIEKSGVIGYVMNLLGYNKDAYEGLGITNLMRILTKSDKYTAKLRALTIGEFERNMMLVNTQSQLFTKDITDIFSSKSAIVDGEKVDFKAPRLLEKNSYRVGVVSALEQVADFDKSLENIVGSLKELSSTDGRKSGYKSYLENTKEALQSLGLVDGFIEDEYGVITDVIISKDASVEKMFRTLNDRENALLKHSKSNFSSISKDVRKAAMSYYGVDLDISSNNYLPRTPFFTGERFKVSFDEPVFTDLPENIRRLRASSTFERTENLNLNRADGSFIHYDFDFYNTIPRRFHESLTTARTSGSTLRLSKIINSKEFQKFISGKYNLSPKNFDNNRQKFIEHVSEYVNMQRKPSVLSKVLESQIGQRGRIAKFFYGRLLNTWDAAIKQYVPGVTTLVLEGGVAPYMKANAIFWDSIKGSYGKKLLIDFVKNTAQTNRTIQGIEALHSNSKAIDNSSFTRGAKDAFDLIDKLSVTSRSLEFGDTATSVQALIIGYMKGLKISGKIKNYSEFDLETELNNGLDQYALSYAENFLSFVNNESNTAAKAKIFRDKNAGILRTLQSFNHNQTTNFLIDIGRFSDSTNKDERIESAKRISQYISNQSIYAGVAWALGDLNYQMAKFILKDIFDVDFGPDEEIEDEQKKANFENMVAGAAIDSFLGRQNIAVAQAFKGGFFGPIFEARNKYNKEELAKKGMDVSKYRGWAPIGKNDVIGISGTFFDDLKEAGEAAYSTVTGDIQEAEELIKSQRAALRGAYAAQTIGMITPARDISRLGKNLKRSILNKPIKQVDYDAEMYHISNDTSGQFEPGEVEFAQQYLKILESKNKNYKAYEQNTLKPLANKNYAIGKITKKSAIESARQKFGPDYSKVVNNILNDKVKNVPLVLTNRFPDVYPKGAVIPADKIQSSNSINNPQVEFMLMHGVVSPAEYAFSFAIDKNGKFREDLPEETIEQIVYDRYQDAVGFDGARRRYFNYNELIKYMYDFKDKLYKKSDREGK